MTTNCNCNVTSCCHNNDNCCCRLAITVRNDSQGRPKACCADFSESPGESFRNSCCSHGSLLEIECMACDCCYNDNHRCTAKHVDITGSCASSACQTSCATYKEK